MVEFMRHQVNGTDLTVMSRSPRRETHPPVLLLPGTGATAADWDTVATDLSQDGTVHALDLRGHGRSEWPGRYSIDLMAADLVDLLPRLGGQLDLIGPRRPRSLPSRGLRRTRATPARTGGSRVTPPPHARHTHETRGRSRLRLGGGRAGPSRDRRTAPPGRTLAHIAIPTLAVRGGPSSFLPQEHIAELVALLKQGHLVTIDAGHSVHIAKPGEFIREVRAFSTTERHAGAPSIRRPADASAHDR